MLKKYCTALNLTLTTVHCKLCANFFSDSPGSQKKDRHSFPIVLHFKCKTNFPFLFLPVESVTNSVFMQYLPFVMLIEAVLIIFIEKLLMKFPRVSGKIERFYGTIVEESLFGKDPDVAEDVQDDKCNVDIIARRRRRNEVCMSLKRSSLIHNVYILKNSLEIVFLVTIIPVNMLLAIDSQENLKPSKCVINILEFPELGISEEGRVYYNCEGKKVRVEDWIIGN